MRKTTDPPRRGSRPDRRARVALAGGAIGLVVFLVVVAVDGSTRTDGYDGTRHWISLLARGDRAWVGSAALALAAVAALAAAWGAARVPVSGAPPRLALWMAGVGACFSLAAVFPVDPVPSYPLGSPPPSLSVAGALHSLGGSAVVVLLALVAWSARSLAPGGLRSAWRTASVSVVAVVAACPVVATAAVLVSGPSWEDARVGVFQRVAIGTGVVWFVATALVLASGASAPPVGEPVVDLTPLGRRSEEPAPGP